MYSGGLGAALLMYLYFHCKTRGECQNADVHCAICGMKLTKKQLVIMVMGVVI